MKLNMLLRDQSSYSIDATEKQMDGYVLGDRVDSIRIVDGCSMSFKYPFPGHCLAYRDSDSAGRMFLHAPNTIKRFRFACIHFICF